jgi:hypothetical protein
MPKYPQTDFDLSPKGDEFLCAQCGKRKSTNSIFSITASGLIDKGKTGDGRLQSPADVVKLSLWHEVDQDLRQAIELPLAQGGLITGVASVLFCSADCLKNYMLGSVDELVRRAGKT